MGQLSNDLMKCKCGETDPDKFYGSRKWCCAKCYNAFNKASRAAKRARIIKHMGGKCRACGFDKYPAALDIHHLDPTIKDSKFQSIGYWKWERIVKEIESCILLCRNCHAGYHTGYSVVW